MRSDGNRQSRHRAGLLQCIIHLRQNPRADALLSLENLQGARPIRRLRAGNGRRTVVIGVTVNFRRIVDRIMVVQDHGTAVVAKRADEGAKILMHNLVADDDVLHLDRLDREREHIGHAGMRRAAVGNGDRQQQAVDGFDAVLHLAEGLLAEHRQETISRRLGGFRLHADVVSPSRQRVGVGHEFRAALAERCSVAVQAVDTIGNHIWVEICQPRFQRHNEVKFRIRLRGVRVRARKHAHARDRQRVLREGDERRVGEPRRRNATGSSCRA